jgi:hypothetical protein
MDTDTNLNSEQDQQAVQAVRAGNAERYRELVERHERRVFAVAWSRLGDAALAEDAAQEAFVRFSLAALEILGGLDKIDREECVRGILRRHHGRGFFDSPSSGSYNEYKINGDQRDTFCAFESLRILGALDRVKDLDKWRFRPAEASERGAAPREVTWDENEAWVCARRLARDLAEHQQNPAAPWRSLLDP